MWLIRRIMGGTDSKYISELSDSESSEEEPTVMEKPPTLSANKNVNSTDITTDAALRTNASFPNPLIVLDSDKVLGIENSLEDEEIVSLVYLLFEDTHYALQELLILLQGGSKKLLHSWAVNQETKGCNWQNQLIEALCVIKNYEALRRLGFKKTTAIDHFLPHNALTSLHLNKIKKATYLICESLNSAKTRLLLQHVTNQLNNQTGIFKEFYAKYLELCFMQWEITKTVTLMDIKKILKVMEEERLCNILDDVLPKTKVSDSQQTNGFITSPRENTSKSPSIADESYSSQTLRNAFFEHQLPSTSNVNNTEGLTSNTSVDNYFHQEYVPSNMDFMEYQLPSVSMGQKNTKKETNNDDNRYHINPNKPGIVLIINQEEFYKEVNAKYKHLLPNTKEKLESRIGTEKDRDDLERVFKKFGFKVIVENNLNHTDMVNKIKEVVKLVKDESSLFICILTHGDKGIVYGSNSCRVKVNNIKEIMYKTNKANLMDKPKILILQSCQGQQCQNLEEDEEEEEEEEGDADDNSSLTTDGPSALLRDMYTFWATIPGYAAIRDKRNGSWFIQALCKKMEEIGSKHHFADICTRTANDVTNRIWTKNETDKKAMTPYVQSTLLKDFYLPPIKKENIIFLGGEN